MTVAGDTRVLDELRAAAASFIGTESSLVAITGGASEGLSQSAELVGTADASVVLVSSDFTSVSYPWLLAARRSATRITAVHDRPDEDLTTGLVDAIDETTTPSASAQSSTPPAPRSTSEQWPIGPTRLAPA